MILRQYKFLLATDQSDMTMKKVGIHLVLLFSFLCGVECAGAAQVGTLRIDNCESQGDYQAVYCHCNKRCLSFFYHYNILTDDGSHIRLGTVARYPMLYSLPGDSGEETLECGWAFDHLPTTIANSLVEADFSDIAAGCSLFGRRPLSENGISEITIWHLFADFRFAASLPVTDDRSSDSSSPFPAPVLLMSCVLIGLIGFRRTVVET